MKLEVVKVDTLLPAGEVLAVLTHAVKAVSCIVADFACTFPSDMVAAECGYLLACQVDCASVCPSSTMLAVKQVVELFHYLYKPHRGVPFPEQVEVSFI